MPQPPSPQEEDRLEPIAPQRIDRIEPFPLHQVQHQFQSPEVGDRIAALAQAIQYGQEGVNLVIRALRDREDAVQQAAYLLLCDRPEARVKRALELFSEAGINYMPLRDVLRTQQWQVADLMTKELMLKALGMSPTGRFQPHHLKNFPCDDLQILDRLWMRHSRGRFGFTVQQRLWQGYATLYWNKSDVWLSFADRVGWRINHLLRPNYWKRYSEMTFSLKAPVGHLPFLGSHYGIFTIEAIVNRLKECNTNPES